MCQLWQFLLQTLGHMEERFEAWLTSKRRTYPQNVLRREFLFHVFSLVMFLAAFVWVFAGLVLHHKEFRKDEATLGVGIATMLAVITMILVLFPLTCYRCHRYENAFILVGVLHIVCAILYVIVWALNTTLNRTSQHTSGLLLGTGSVLSITSAVVYFYPEACLNRCRGNNAGQQPNHGQGPPPPYAQAVANQRPRGLSARLGSYQPVPQVPPPPYSPPQQSLSLSSSSAAAASPARQLTTTTQEAQDQEWVDVEEEGKDENTGGGGAVSPRRRKPGQSLGRPRNSGQSRSRGRSRSGGRSLSRGRKTRPRERTRSRGAGRSSSRGRRGGGEGGGGGGGTTNQAVGRPMTRSRSLRERTS